jgi:hypothetical protein
MRCDAARGTGLRVSLRLWVLLACAATQATASATGQNPADLQCIQRKVAFDGVEPLTYATVVGEQGFKLRVYREYPGSCSAQPGTRCNEGGYLVPGDELAQAKTCASWSYIQFIGKDRVTVGWVAADALRSRPVSPEPEAEVAVINDQPKHYHFRLTQGPHVPVCEAYLQRLNQTRFTCPAYCDEGVMPYPPKVAVDTAAGRRPGPTPWRYSEPIDINNSGSPQQVVIWDWDAESQPACGVPHGHDVSPTRPGQVALIASADLSSIDQAKTIRTFGHPDGGMTGGSALSAGTVRFVRSLRLIGYSYGVFEYRGRFYFDTFFDVGYAYGDGALNVGGDFSDQRKRDRRLNDTLAVFENRNRETAQICEYFLAP